MNLKSRLSALLVLLVFPLHVSAVISHEKKDEVQKKLDEAVAAAAAQYRSYRYTPIRSEEDIAKAEEQLEKIEYEKRTVELELHELVASIREVEEGYGIDITNTGAVMEVRSQEAEHFADYIRYLYSKRSLVGDARQDQTDRVLGLVLHSTGELADRDARKRVLQNARMRLLALVLDADDNVARKVQLEEKLVALEEDHRSTKIALEGAKNGRQIGGAVNPAVKKQVQDMHSAILRMQSELARIDAKLRRKAKQSLIEKGLLAPSEAIDTSSVQPFTPRFIRPVYGPVTAGFMEPSYTAFYGVPHRGTDIAVPKGTPVVAAADGVVFVARDGGQHGYSYVLVGHRGGYATVYGHLFQLSVQPGQEVRAGEVVGISGGLPGDWGTGPMSTGAHVHFEMLHNGKHLNALSLMP